MVRLDSQASGWRLFGLFLLVCLVDFAPFRHPAHCRAAENATYEWENLDYYELLGVSARDDEETIKKAYRSQAKKYHPDKLIHQESSNTTKEENNARFAKIAEAYQVLASPKERQLYDQYLRDKADYHRQQQERRHSNDYYDPWSSEDSLFRGQEDPFAIFEQFFGAFDEDGFFSDQASIMMDLTHNGQEPVQIIEQQEVYEDDFGQEILRVMQRADYPDSYFQIVAQDFVEEWDPYAHSFVFRPAQESPVVVEEGYRDGCKQHGASRGASRRSDILWPGELLNSNHELQQSIYRASVTPTCELQVIDHADTVLWSSPTISLVPQPCAAQLQGPQLVLHLGNGQVLWYSPPPNDDYDLYLSSATTHIARLDCDASLSIYRLERPSVFWAQLWRDTQAIPIVQEWVERFGRLLGVDHETPAKLVCVYSTSVVGCWEPLRSIVGAIRRIAHMMRRFVNLWGVV